MIRTVRAQGLQYDAAGDAGLFTVEEVLPEGVRKAAQLLLDAQGFVVGVDFGDEARGRVTVLLGRHEDVATTRTADVTVERSTGGSVVRVRKGRAARLHERNPYA